MAKELTTLKWCFVFELVWKACKIPFFGSAYLLYFGEVILNLASVSGDMLICLRVSFVIGSSSLKDLSMYFS